MQYELDKKNRERKEQLKALAKPTWWQGKTRVSTELVYTSSPASVLCQRFLMAQSTVLLFVYLFSYFNKRPVGLWRNTALLGFLLLLLLNF